MARGTADRRLWAQLWAGASLSAALWAATAPSGAANPSDPLDAAGAAAASPPLILAQADQPPPNAPAALDESRPTAPPPTAPAEDGVRSLLRSIIDGDGAAPPLGPTAAPAIAVPDPLSPNDAAPVGLDGGAVGSELSAIARPVRGGGSAAAARLREPTLDYLEGVLGARHVQPQFGRSCARLSRLMAPPLMESAKAAPDRADPAALRLAFGGAVSDAAAASLATAFYSDAALPAAVTPLASGGGLQTEAERVRLIRPKRVIAARAPRIEAALAAGASDVAIGVRPAGPATIPDGALEAEGRRLIGFEAIALVAHPDNATKRLTRRDLGALLSGAASDWSMINPTQVGAPRLYLPPQGSPELAALQQTAGVRRLNVRGARYEPDPARRVAAALADPNGLAAATRSALGEAEPLAIGRPGSESAPTLDNLRSGLYPLAMPLYVVVPPTAAHPAATLFADFLSRPLGQRALFEAGLMPVAACDPSTCNLDAPGLHAARVALTPQGRQPPIEILQGRPPGGPAPLAEVVYPAGASPTPDATVESLLTMIKTLSARPERDRYLVIARAGVIGADAPADRVRQAMTRAEATALSLRCAGMIVTQIAVDAQPLSGAFDTRDQIAAIPVEVISLQP